VPPSVPAKAKGVPNYLQLQEFGLKFMNKSGKTTARFSKIQTKRKYSAVEASLVN
jgi:hypothetical protein